MPTWTELRQTPHFEPFLAAALMSLVIACAAMAAPLAGVSSAPTAAAGQSAAAAPN